jgi:hypothetical protein
VGLGDGLSARRCKPHERCRRGVNSRGWCRLPHRLHSDRISRDHPGGTRRARARRVTHLPDTEACSELRIEGSATFTIVVSSPTTNRLEPQISRTRSRRLRLSPAVEPSFWASALGRESANISRAGRSGRPRRSGRSLCYSETAWSIGPDARGPSGNTATTPPRCGARRTPQLTDLPVSSQVRCSRSFSQQSMARPSGRQATRNQGSRTRDGHDSSSPARVPRRPLIRTRDSPRNAVGRPRRRRGGGGRAARLHAESAAPGPGPGRWAPLRGPYRSGTPSISPTPKVKCPPVGRLRTGGRRSTVTSTGRGHVAVMPTLRNSTLPSTV